ncbi:MAG: response regulator transcription factor [Xanthobacteraceae bacterium]|nr:response regulator transcription factor [Xanthobacteraceae bacterium]
MRLLLIEDDMVLLDGIRTGFNLSGVLIEAVSTCQDARAVIFSEKFDAFIIDIMLPDGSGLDLLAEIRNAEIETPIVLLTALDEINDRIKGLDLGADDYLGKPFDLDELAARVRAVVRRGNGRAMPLLRYNDLVVDPVQMTATTGGDWIALSRREFSLLTALMDRPGAILSKDAIESRLYGWQEEIESNAVEVHIHKLRSKIGRHRIETVRGVGYRIGSGVQ